MAISQGSIGAGGPVGLSLLAWALTTGGGILKTGMNVASTTYNGGATMTLVVVFSAPLASSDYLVDLKYERNSGNNLNAVEVSAKSVNGFTLTAYNSASTKVSILSEVGPLHLSVWR